MNLFRKITGVVLVLATCAAMGYTQDDQLRSRVEALFKQWSQCIESKDLDALKELYADDFVVAISGMGFDGLKKQLENLYEKYGQLKSEWKIDKIQRFGPCICVFSTASLSGKSKDGSDWEKLDDKSFMDTLKEVDGVLKFYSTMETNRENFRFIQENKYVNDVIGMNFTVPNDWIMVPIALPNMYGSVAFGSPDEKNGGMFGYLEIPPNISVKQAVEGDEHASRQLMKDKYEFIEAGETTVVGNPAYQSISEFTMEVGEKEIERKRNRVYFANGGLLYVFIFDAVPPTEWERLKPNYESILASVGFSAEADGDAATRLRAKSSSGEITDRIYTNDKYGFQIAVPEDWKITQTPMGEAFSISLTLSPGEGDDFVSVLAAETKGSDKTLDDLIEAQIKGVNALTEAKDPEPVQEVKVGNHTGKSFVQEFTLEGLGSIKRKTVMFLVNDVLYMIFCNAKPPQNYSNIEARFDAIIDSFTVN